MPQPGGYLFDVMIVTAFPGDYSPVRTSVIGALHSLGVSVQALSEGSIREFPSLHCWLSEPLLRDQAQRIGAKRILCFEPPVIPLCLKPHACLFL